MAYACRYCIAAHGLRGSSLAFLPRNEEELIEHIERVHHMPVRADDETVEDAERRFARRYPEAVTCEHCIAAGAPWTKT